MPIHIYHLGSTHKQRSSATHTEHKREASNVNSAKVLGSLSRETKKKESPTVPCCILGPPQPPKASRDHHVCGPRTACHHPLTPSWRRQNVLLIQAWGSAPYIRIARFCRLYGYAQYTRLNRAYCYHPRQYHVPHEKSSADHFQ